MKKQLVGFSILLAMMLGGCGQDDLVDAGPVVDELVPIEVDLQGPDAAEGGEELTFTSIITQGEDKVEDATEVVYEIWEESNKESSELIEATEQDGHHYTLRYQFDKNGLYHVQTHVTARGLHRMPSMKIQVGQEEGHHHEEGSGDEANHHHEHEHGNADVTINKMDNKVEFHITVNDEPFTNGQVTLEMRDEKAESPKWIDLSEQEDGTYTMNDLESYNGPYKVIVHLQSDTIHEHVDVEISF